MNKTLHILPILGALEESIRDYFPRTQVAQVELFGKSQISITPDGSMTCQKPAILIVFGGVTGSDMINQKDQLTIEFVIINDSAPNTYERFAEALEICQNLFNFLLKSSVPGVLYYVGSNSYSISIIDDNTSYDIKLSLSMTFTIIN